MYKYGIGTWYLVLYGTRYAPKVADGITNEHGLTWYSSTGRYKPANKHRYGTQRLYLNIYLVYEYSPCATACMLLLQQMLVPCIYGPLRIKI